MPPARGNLCRCWRRWFVCRCSISLRTFLLACYINGLFTDFDELHGDRAYADDPAIVGGIARFEGQPVMVIGHQKGRDTKEKIYRNFGMPRPEG